MKICTCKTITTAAVFYMCVYTILSAWEQDYTALVSLLQCQAAVHILQSSWIVPG